MRKLILITSIALMSTSSCYANLSLASNEAPQTLVQQSVGSGDALRAEPKPQTRQVRPDVATKIPTVSRSTRVHQWRGNHRSQGSREHCF
jgi:hypothetical protein